MPQIILTTTFTETFFWEERMELHEGVQYLLYRCIFKNIHWCLNNNPQQIQRIADSLYAMTAEETVISLCRNQRGSVKRVGIIDGLGFKKIRWNYNK